MIRDSITIEGAILEYDKEKSWWRKLFRWDAPPIRALKEADFNNRDALVKILGRFVEHTPDTPLTFHLVYHALAQYLFYDPAAPNKKPDENKISELREALARLYKRNLLTVENFDAISLHPKPVELVEALSILMVNKILTTENLNSPACKALKTHCDPADFAKAMLILSKAKILNRGKVNSKSINTMNATIDAVKGHNRPEALAEALTILKEAGRLIPEALEFLKGHAEPVQLAEALLILIKGQVDLVPLAKALLILEKAGRLIPEALEFLKGHAEPVQLAEALLILEKAGRRLTPEALEFLKGRAEPVEFAKALVILEKGGQRFLIPEMREFLKGRAEPVEFAKALNILSNANKLLNQENFNAIKAHSKPVQLAEALLRLEKAELKFSDREDFKFTCNVLKAYPDPLCFANAFNKVHGHHDKLSKTLRMLNNEGVIIFLTGTFNAILIASNSADIVNVQSVLQSILKGANISLTKDGSDFIKEQNDLVPFVNTLGILEGVRLLTQANFDVIKEQADPVPLFNALSTLDHHDLLTQANFDVIKEQADPVPLFNALSTLHHHHELLTQVIFDGIKGHPKPEEFAKVLTMLMKYNLLTRAAGQANFNAINEHTTKPDNLVKETIVPGNSVIFSSINPPQENLSARRQDSAEAQPNKDQKLETSSATKTLSYR